MAKSPATKNAPAAQPVHTGGSTAGPEASLAQYNAKRDFSKTAEPQGVRSPRNIQPAQALQFVIQKHWASHLHYDFRLELDGVMASWAVPKGPSLDPMIKRMAIHVEDHPVSYNTFEGEIPQGEYGGGTVIVWDRGTWTPIGDPREGLDKGKLVFALHGQKLAGLWELVRISKPSEKKQNRWLLFKKRGDEWARPSTEYDVVTALPDSVIKKSLRPLETMKPDVAVQPKQRPQADTTAMMQGVRKAKLPAQLAPQLATLVTFVPQGDWVIESKFDGYRVLARIEGEQVQIFTRNGNDWTDKLKPIASALARFGLTRAWLDGEIVVLNDAGIPDFNRLQHAIDHNARTRDIVLFVFDLPFLGEKDLRAVPLIARRAVLQQLFNAHESECVRLSQAFDSTPDQLLAAACEMGLEGVIVKRADAPYVSGRSETWLKLKCQLRQEFVVLGFTDRAGAAKEIGSLLLGYYDNGELRQAGAVGTGWDAAMRRQLYTRLTHLEIAKPPAHAAQPSSWAKRRSGSIRWVAPSMVVEVAFGEWTPDKQVRHAVFRGIRTDKPATEIVRECAKVNLPTAKNAVAIKTSSVKITHAQRIIDPTTGLRKIDLVRYYESIAEWILPHLKDRPVSLVRAPTGITGELFFQKHPEAKMPGIKELDPTLWPGHEALLAVNSAQALISATQMNVVEFHTWNSKIAHMHQPDRFILDLDPGEGVTWPELVEAAELTHVMLTELGLESWLKTSGSKGLHVVVPITPRLEFAEVKAFTQALAKHMAKVIPSKFTAVMGEKNRVGKIFIDYLRNGPAQTTACAFCARSQPGMGISMPIRWEQLREVKSSAQWTLATAHEYLSFQKEDPWSAYWTKKQTISRGIQMLK